MSQPVVCDASALVALLIDAGPDGTWVTEALTDAYLAAPALIGWETANKSDAPLVTLDRQIAGATGIDCPILVPSG